MSQNQKEDRQMKKRVCSILLALILMLTMVPAIAWAGNPTDVSPEQVGTGVPIVNASEGRTFQSAKEVSFGSTYYNYWTKDNDHLCYYVKFTVPQRGKVDFYFTKPYDDEGEYGKLKFALYKEDADNQIWTEDCWYLQYNASDRYSFTMGLNPGTYYLSILPGFYVTSGLIETNFKFTFTATNDYEVEPNASASQATVLSHGIHYGANYGGDDENDYFRFAAKAGKSYKIYIGNFAKITPTSIMIELIAPSGDQTCISFEMQDQGTYDSNGDYYLLSNAEAGNYTIRVENYHQAQIHYTVGIFEPGKSYGPPSITTQPKSATVDAGKTATFTVTAKGSDLNYQWQYRTGSSGSWSNTAWSGNKTSTLKVTASAGMNGYQYRCKVSNGYGTVYSSAATMTVRSAPSITSQPKSVSAAEGSSATFTVAATGGSLSYQWQFKKPDGSWQNCSSGTSKTLTVEAKGYRDGYRYRCKVSNSLGTVYSNSVKLTVVKLSVTTQPKSVSAAVGDTATFTVKAQGSGLSYQWQYKKTGSTAWNNCSGGSAKSATLSITAESYRDGYQYRCKITDTNGNTVCSNAATLTVKPKITSQPADVSAAPGNTVSFTVKASGVSLSYQWQYKKTDSTTWNNCSGDSAKSATLSLTAESYRNGYQYRCRITDAHSTVTYSNAATLTVLSKPQITAQPKSVDMLVGSTATFTVSATGADRVYQWQYRTSSGAAWTDCTVSGAKTATLKIKAASHRNGYQYRCKVSNGLGTVYSDAATLTVFFITAQPEPAAVVVNQTATFSVQTSGEVLSYQWQCYNGTEWTDCSSSSARTATLSVTAESYRNGYRYRCKVSTAVGDIYSNSAALYICDKRLTSTLYWTKVNIRPEDEVGWDSSYYTLAIAGTGAIPDYEGAGDYDYSPSPWNDDSDLRSVVIGKGVTGVGSYAFERCDYLYSVYLPDSLISIGAGAFRDCDNLKSVTIPASVRFIGAYAFNYCRNLTKVVFPAGLTTIGEGAFYYCDDLKSVTIPASVRSIGASAFYGCRNLKAFNVDPANPSYCSIDGVLYDKQLTKLIQCPAQYKGRFSIPDTVTAIGNSAFKCCEQITEVVFPAGLTTIGNGAFADCYGLTDVTIPEGVTEICGGTFYDCKNLSSVTIPDSVESIGINAFKQCKYLNVIIMGSGVKTIGQNAFYQCSSLVDVYYNGTEAMWNQISIDSSGNNPLKNATIHYLQ